MGDIRPAVEKMDDVHRAIVAPRSGRPKKLSIFHDHLRDAIGTDEAFKIDIPEGMKPATIVSELQKAAKEHSVRLKIWKRDAASLTPEQIEQGIKPFVGFQVIEKVAPAASTPAPAAGAQAPEQHAADAA